MQRVRRKPRIISLGLSMDWPLAIVSIIGGIWILRVASDSNTWRQVVDGDESAATVALIVPIEGQVRLRAKGSTYWTDLSDRLKVHEGDMIATGTEGVAYLNFHSSLRDKNEIRIDPDSLVVVRLEKSNAPAPNWWEQIVEPAKLSSRPALEVKKGSVSPVKAKATARSAPKPAPIIIKSTRPTTRTVASAPHLNKGPTLPPEVIGPSNDTRLVSASKTTPEPVMLRWQALPRTTTAEVELRKAGDDAFKAELQPGPIGAQANLLPGNYVWRARTTTAQGKQSAWSEPAKFTITDRQTLAAAEAQLRRLAEEREAEAKRRQALLTKQREATLAQQRAQALALARAAELARIKTGAAQKAQAAQRALAATQNLERQKRYLAIVSAAKERLEVLDTNPDRIKTSRTAQLTESLAIDRNPGYGNTALKENTELDKLVVRLTWRLIPSVTSYEIKIRKNNEVIQSADVRGNHYDLVLTALDPKSSYTYQVSGTLQSGKAVSSEITPISIEVSPPVPVEPPDGSTNDSRDPVQFTWAKTVLTETYELEISHDPELRTLLEKLETSDNVILVRLRRPGQYFWRVRGITRSYRSSWSPVRRFWIR